MSEENKGGARSLVRKLAEVMAGLSRLPKNGFNSAHSYRYLLEADVMEAVRTALGERHVLLTHTVASLVEREHKTSKGNEMRVVRVELRVTAHDGETGESMDVAHTFGEASDSLDKAVYKAITGAWKYALMKLFLVSSGDDPEVERKKGAAQGAQSASGPAGMVLPNFGDAAGQPVEGQPLERLEWYRKRLQKSVEDPTKAKYAEKNKAQLAAIEAEAKRQQEAKAAPPAPPPTPSAEDVRKVNADFEAAKKKWQAEAEKLAKACGVEAKKVGEALRAKGITSMGGLTDKVWDAFEKEFRYRTALRLATERNILLEFEKWCVGNSCTEANFTADFLNAWQLRAEELAEPGTRG